MTRDPGATAPPPPPTASAPPRFAGRVVLVTGAAHGIGAATAERLAAEGAHVVLADLDAAAGAARTDALLAAGRAASFVTLDVAEEAQWVAAIAAVIRSHGGLDALVNNAGIAPVGSIESTTLEAFRRAQRINVEGTFLGIKHGADALRRRGALRPAGAAIVNLSSVLGKRAIPDNVAYGTSKGAVTQMTKCAAIEFAARGERIRVNSVHPAITETPMVAAELVHWAANGTLGTTDLEETRRRFAERLPLRRLGRPEEVAAMVAFACSDDCAFTTGAEFAVDGGRLAA